MDDDDRLRRELAAMTRTEIWDRFIWPDLEDGDIELVKHGYADHRASLKQDVRLVVNNDPR